MSEQKKIGKNDLDKWIEQENRRMEKERSDYMDSHDMKSFWSPEKGSNKITLLAKVPRATKSDFGDKMAFRVVAEGQEWDWNINPKSPMYRQFVKLLAKAPVEITIIRTGDGKQTRYDLKE